MEYIITPFAGIQGVHFGMTRTVIRALLGPPDHTFRRGDAENQTDYYSRRGLFLEFNAEEACVAIEFSDSVRVLYKGVNLFALPFYEMRDFYDRFSNDVDEEGTKSVTYHDLGFSISRNEENSEVETVLIFSKEYFEE